MRVRVRKRKIVPITATVQIKEATSISETIGVANAVKSQLWQLIGKKVYEFCKINYDISKTAPGFLTATATLKVVDSREERNGRKC